MTDTDKIRADDKPADAFSRVVEFLRKPGVIVTLLGFVGLKGQDVVAEVNTLLSMDLPAWSGRRGTPATARRTTWQT